MISSNCTITPTPDPPRELETPVLETLWDAVTRHGAAARRVLYDRHGSCTLSALAGGSLFTDLESLRGRCVLIATREQLATAIALVELDGEMCIRDSARPARR